MNASIMVYIRNIYEKSSVMRYMTFMNMITGSVSQYIVTNEVKSTQFSFWFWKSHPPVLHLQNNRVKFLETTNRHNRFIKFYTNFDCNLYKLLLLVMHRLHILPVPITLS